MLPVLAHLESAAASPHHLPRARRARRLGGVSCLEKVEPQLPVGDNAQVPLKDSDKMAAYAMELGLKLWCSMP